MEDEALAALVPLTALAKSAVLEESALVNDVALKLPLTDASIC